MKIENKKAKQNDLLDLNGLIQITLEKKLASYVN
jgi:hypothetical protein